MSKTLTQLLSDLVAFQSVSESQQPIDDCFDYVENFLAKCGMQTTRHIVNGTPSIIASTKKKKSAKIMLQAHLDVVPGSESLFTMHEKEGKLYGRGVFDMKFAGAVFLKLVDDLRDELESYDFSIMFTSDEEIGSPNGVGAILDLGYKADACVLPDAGDNWCIETTQKGVWIVNLSTVGLSVHGSRPWEGDNAIERLIRAINEIKDLFNGQHAKSDTLSVNKIFGGEVANQVADWAEATLDIRFMSTKNHTDLITKIETIAVAHNVKINNIACIQPVETDLEDPLVKSFLSVAEIVKGEPIGQIHSLGNSDAHFFAERKIPVILMRPDGGAPHSDMEWLDRASFEKYYELIKAYVQKEAKL
jgi:succinyl-diaminopimelate desuccinylase